MHQNDPARPLVNHRRLRDHRRWNATVYKPDVSNQTALVNEIARALSGVKSCTFDLNNLNGKKLTVDQTMLDKVAVKVQDCRWYAGHHQWMADELGLRTGAGGQRVRRLAHAQNMNIDIQIPCAAIIIK